MAGGQAVRRSGAFWGILAVLLLVGGYAVAAGWRPVKTVEGFVDRLGSLASPEPAWTVQAGGPPEDAVLAGGAAIIRYRGGVESRDAGSGALRWRRDADWSAVAGGGDAVVVLVGKGTAGMQALDPATGKVRWDDAAAVAAWGYRDAVLAVTCPGSGGCALTRRAPGDGGQRWRTAVPGLDRSAGRQAGGSAGPPGSPRDLADRYTGAASVVPGDLPPLVGVPVGGRTETIDTATGGRSSVGVPRGARAVTAGGLVITVTAAERDGGCRFTIEARRPAGGTAWRREGYDPHTGSGTGCVQRHDPAGGAAALVVTRGDKREALLAAGDGHEVWVGGPGESVRAVDDRYALVRAADGRTVRLVDAGSGEVRWQQRISDRAALVLCPDAAVVVDWDDRRATAYQPDSGRRLVAVRTGADLLGCGTAGLVLGRGRSVGPVRFATGGAPN